MVAVGGGAGSVARYLVATMFNRPAVEGSSGFPWGTLGVNVLGSLLIGVVMGLMATRWAARDELRLALAVGVLGGFTTLSSFSWETLVMLQAQQFARAAAYVGATIVLGIGAAWVGWMVVKGV